VLQLPLAVAAFDSLTPYGAALMAGLGAGLWKDLEELRRIMPAPTVVRPDAGRAAVGDDGYRRWLATTEAMLRIGATVGDHA